MDRTTGESELGTESAGAFTRYGSALMGGQLAEVNRWRAAYQQGGDPEALHQLRVAVRRARTIVEVFGPAGDGSAKQTKRALRVLAEELGIARDLDVVLAQMTRWGQASADVDFHAVADRVFRCDIYRAAASAIGLSCPAEDRKPVGAHGEPAIPPADVTPYARANVSGT